MVDCCSAFQSFTVCMPKDLQKRSVDVHVIRILDWFTSFSRTFLVLWNKRMKDIGTTTLWCRILRRKAKRWVPRRSSGDCHSSWFITDVTLVWYEYCKVAQSMALHCILPSLLLCTPMRGSHIVSANSLPERTSTTLCWWFACTAQGLLSICSRWTWVSVRPSTPPNQCVMAILGLVIGALWYISS